jgi:signal peptidase I
MTSVAQPVERNHRRRSGHRLVAVVLAVLLLGALVRVVLVDTVRVSLDSMAPTLCAGDVLLVARWRPRSWQVGDIITFSSPADGSPSVKRIVALAGQRVAIEDAQLVVDGHWVTEPYVDHDTIDGWYYGPVTVPVGSVLVMGDHREVSVDSRSYGPVPISDLNGRRLATLWSSCPR